MNSPVALVRSTRAFTRTEPTRARIVLLLVEFRRHRRSRARARGRGCERRIKQHANRRPRCRLATRKQLSEHVQRVSARAGGRIIAAVAQHDEFAGPASSERSVNRTLNGVRCT